MAVLQALLPVFASALLGYLLAYKKAISESQADIITKTVFITVIPALLFLGAANAELPEDMPWDFLSSYYIAVLVIYLAGLVVASKVFSYSPKEQSIYAMGAAYSNVTIVGLPVCVYLLGEESLLPLFIIVSVHNLALFTLGMLFAERGSWTPTSMLVNVVKILPQLVTSPITGSLLLGAIFNVFALGIYQPVNQVLGVMSDGAVPAALFVLGASLNKYHISGNLKSAGVMVAIKMLGLPLLAWLLAFHVFTLDPLWASTAVMTAAMPVGISVYIFAEQYRACEAPVATAIVLSTVLSAVTLSLLAIIMTPITY
jgi:predicted permease